MSCGLLAIAAATELVNDPTKFMLDVDRMRKHLAHCLESKQLTQFPLVKGRICSKVVQLESNHYQQMSIIKSTIE